MELKVDGKNYETSTIGWRAEGLTENEIEKGGKRERNVFSVSNLLADAELPDEKLLKEALTQAIKEIPDLKDRYPAGASNFKLVLEIDIKEKKED